MASGSGDHYRVLGVQATASAAEVRKAYLQHARRHHPDRHQASPPAVRAEHDRAMREVNAAWAVLGDVQRRRRYDEQLADLAVGDTPHGAARGSQAREQRWADEDAAKAAWRPFDDSTDDPDPRLLADEPPPAFVPGRSPRLTLGYALKVSFALGVGFFVGGALSGAATVSGAGVVLMALAGALFLALPLLALGRSVRNDTAADRRRAEARRSAPPPKRPKGTGR